MGSRLSGFPAQRGDETSLNAAPAISCGRATATRRPQRRSRL